MYSLNLTNVSTFQYVYTPKINLIWF